MERRVEYGALRHVRQQGLHRRDAFQVGRVVQGRERNTGFQVGHDFGVDQNAFLELLAAVRHTVAYGAYLGHVLNHAVLRMHQIFEHPVDALGMVGYRLAHLEFILSLGLMRQVGMVQTDAFHQTLGQQIGFLLGFHIYQLILDRRTPAVQY